MKKLALVSAIIIGGLFTQTANAQVGINVRAHFGSGNGYYPAAHIAVAAPVYREEAPVYYNDRDEYRGYNDRDEYRGYYDRDRRGYRIEEQRFDRDREYSRGFERRRGYDSRENRGYERGNNRYGEQHAYNNERGGRDNYRR
ncbi:MAG: hypothetical protein ACXVAY_20635 [Mucilaginibacter sp.]